VFSLLGDLYDPSRRAGVSSIVQLSTGIGLAMGQGIAGFVGAHMTHCLPCCANVPVQGQCSCHACAISCRSCPGLAMAFCYCQLASHSRCGLSVSLLVAPPRLIRPDKHHGSLQYRFSCCSHVESRCVVALRPRYRSNFRSVGPLKVLSKCAPP
jgi:hypothetical protein